MHEKPLTRIFKCNTKSDPGETGLENTGITNGPEIGDLDADFGQNLEEGHFRAKSEVV